MADQQPAPSESTSESASESASESTGQSTGESTGQSTGAWTGGRIRGGVRCVLAGNPGAMTLDGTNTWLLHAPGDNAALVIDPGPLDEPHLRAVLHAAEEEGLRITAAILTHGHLDHSAGARRFAELAGCPVHASHPDFSLGSARLADGDVLDAGALQLTVIGTPGHSSDSVSFVVPSLRVLLTGDTVLGRGTTVVAYPDGQLGPYLWSLARLRELLGSAESETDLILPGHGPLVTDPAAVVDGYLAHRQARLGQVRDAVAAGDQTARQVVERVYADVDESLWDAAELSVQAQLAYLSEGDPS